MKNICRYFKLLFLFLLISNLSIAQWVQTSGPGGGQISALGTDGTNYYAGISGHGIFVSSDNGVSWKAINTGLSRLNVLSIAAKGSMVLAGTDSNGVFLSTNSGNNWVSINNGLGNLCINVLTINDAAVFAGTNNGVFTSTNNGNTWIADTAGLSNIAIAAFLIKDTLFFAGTTNGVYVSTKNDNHWNLIGPFGRYPLWVSSLVANDSDIFAGAGSGIYESTDNGNHWTTLESAAGGTSALAMVGQNIFGAPLESGGGGILISTDGGKNWSDQPPDGLNLTNIFKLLANNSTILAGGAAALFISTDNGNNWSTAEKGIPFSKVSSMVTNGNYIFAGVTSTDLYDYSGGGISFSTDNGDTWVPCNSGLSDLEINGMSLVGSHVFAGANGGTFYSSNNGASWTQSNQPPYLGMKSIISKGTNLFGIGNGDVYISTNNGSNWTDVSAGLPRYHNSSGTYHFGISSLATIDSILFAGTLGGGVYMSTDNGTHWDTTNSRLAFSSVYSLATRSANIYAGTIKGVFRSTNNGTSWSSIGLTNVVINCFVLYSQNIFVATTSGIFLSKNDSSNWTEIDSGLINKDVNTLAIGGAYLYNGTMGYGVWRRPLSEMITEVKNGIKQFPSRFVLEQNYPNPFNPSSTISFSLPSKSFVSLKVFDIVGREVATIVSEELSAGNHTRQWNAANMSSGIYFYRLQAGSFTETKKLVLLR
jgi:photosystem II stability/assembly factor-like uncharacterized protein